MNWDEIEGKWKQMQGSVREQWGKLTDDDFTQIAGKRDKLVGKIQERYGIAHAEAEKQTAEFTHRLKQKAEEAKASFHDAKASHEAKAAEKARSSGVS